MKWVPKILRRIIVLWCVVGFAKLCILVNPYVQLIAKYFSPEHFAEHPIDATAAAWVILITAIGCGVVLMIGIHWFTKWLFNERD
jgi:hypothetical protein